FTFPPFAGRGYAAAMARELVLLARAAGVASVVAETLPEANPSTRVPQRVGFRRAGEGADDEVGRTWRWSLTRRTQLLGVVNVAPAAREAGANLVNDVTGLRDSDELARLAAKAGARLCVMHMKGVPRTMQQQPHYDDVVGEVLAFLRGAVERAVAAGMPRERV